MTEQEWMNCEDPSKMISSYGVFGDELSKIIVSRTYATKEHPEGLILSERKIQQWAKAVRDLAFPEEKDQPFEIAGLRIVATWGWLWRKSGGYERGKKNCPLSTQADLLREVIGNPFKPIKLHTQPPLVRDKKGPLLDDKGNYTIQRCPDHPWFDGSYNPAGHEKHHGRGHNQQWVQGNLVWRPNHCDECWRVFTLTPSPNKLREMVVPVSWLLWRDGLIPKTAQDIHDNEKWEEMGILADMCEDAGCDNQDLLMHLRGKERCPKCVDGFNQSTVKNVLLACMTCNSPICEDNTPGWIHLRSPHCHGCYVLDALTGRE